MLLEHLCDQFHSVAWTKVRRGAPRARDCQGEMRDGDQRRRLCLEDSLIRWSGASPREQGEGRQTRNARFRPVVCLDGEASTQIRAPAGSLRNL